LNFFTQQNEFCTDGTGSGFQAIGKNNPGVVVKQAGNCLLVGLKLFAIALKATHLQSFAFGVSLPGAMSGP